MNEGPRITRRRLLIAALWAGAASVPLGLARLRPWRVLVEIVPADAGERLAALLAHRESAAAVGSAYLRGAPDEADLVVLVGLIASDLPGGRPALRRATDDDLRHLLADRTRLDFEQERTVSVRGWILSRTEARLYGVVALV